ncbi:putative erythrocyte membrane protein [Schistosoma mansoni]|uniref:putative erythrocyte membrane protein n=1 Tax=Schistosoma mansoni TaxID=6183 RepID=UPI0001A62360|nr:putative erythrocyte membrane protein [Schistosoma mansoni]|eukprot:XP_018654901.1 putative erythrocyte membrane protein [Schistosoma mansoni]
MDQIHEPLLKQCIASLTLNNNILKQNPCDNFCLLKNDANTNQQAAKTVSLVLTRLTNAVNTYVHVLRCNVCDYLTLNPTSLKEHFRLRHPTSLGFLTYTCSQCSSMSTERSLMEEHLRIYHRITENPSAKLIERFHTPTTTSDALGFSCVTPSTMSGGTLPLSLTNSNATTAQSSLALNLVNAIAALQHANKTQSQQATVSTASSSCTTCTVSTVSSTKNTIITPTAENLENSEQDTNLDMQVYQDGTVTVEAQTPTLGSPAFSISGSRRRKATTPGRICLSASKSTNSCSSSEEGDVSTCKINQSITNSTKNEAAITNSPPGAKRGFLSGVDEVDGQIKDDGVGSPMSKRICKNVDNTVTDTNMTKCVSFSNITPFCLPIGNSPADNKQVPLVTFSSPNVNGLNSLSIPSPFFGQLIPLSSLPENVICGLSTTIMNNPQTSTMSNTGDNSITTSTGHHTELQTTQNHPSAWVLTNPSGNLSCNLTQQAELTALQPTLFVPVPTLGDSSVTPTLKVPQSLDTSTTNPLANCAGILRYPDIIEALKCMAANGNLISAVNVPASSYSTNIQTQANNSSNYNDNIERLQSASQISSPNLSSTNNLAALVAHLTASNNSRTIPQSVATNIPNTTCGITSTDNNTADSLSFSTKSTSESSNISNFNALVSSAPVYTKVDHIDSDGTSLVSGLTSVNNIGTNEDINFPSNDQALDMSVRSVSIPSEHSQSFTQTSNITKSDTKNVNLFTGININDSTCKETSTLEQPTFNVVNNVAEVINAAIKGGLKQRLIQSIEVPVSSLFPNPAQCLTALANTISSLPTMNETVVSSDNQSDKRNQNINCQNESYTNTINIKKELMNSTMTNSLQNVEPITLTSGDNKLNDSMNKSAQNSISANALINLPPTSSHIVSLAQLQAIMAALANASSVSISLPVNSTASTSLSLAPACSATVSSLSSSNPSIQQLVNPSTPSISSSGTNVLINTSGSSLNVTGSVTTSEAGNTSLIPGLNNLTSVCGFTLTGPSSFVNNNITTYNPSMSANFGTINSNIKGITVPSGECISLTGILSGNVANLNINNNSNSAQLGHTVVGNPALINFISANKSPVQSSVTLSSTNATRLLTNLATSTTGTNLLSLPNNGTIGNNTNICGSTLLGATNIPSGAISLLDPHQALFAAAAAAAAQNIQKPGGVNNAINQIALANLKLSNTNGRHLGTTAPVIGLLDPRTGLQLRVADTSTTTSAIPTSNLTDCLNNNYSHSSDNEQMEKQINESNRMTTNETDLNQTNELETGSNYEDQIDEEWEPEQDETCSIQSNAQQLCLKRNKICDKTSGNSESPNKNDQSHDLILTNDLQSNLLLGSSNKRSSSSARISGGNSSNNRRGLSSSYNDSSNQQQLRPHRQNFTPTQNRILTEWYQLHQAKPYPSTDDTKELANISGLSYSQVKKWFANKRARSTSSGLPKPTPPLAPDSSTDPSSAAALVAAAVAAATSAVADVNNMMTSTSTSPLNVSSSSSSSSNCSTIISNINSNDTSLSIQPFLLKSKSVSFSTQPYTDLNFLKTENDKQAEFVSNLISSHLQMDEENIQLGFDDIRVNDNDSMTDMTTISCDPIYYSVSSPPTLHVHINNRLSSPTNHLNTLSSVSSSSSSSLSSSSSSDEEYHKDDKMDNNKTTLKEKKNKVKTKLPTYDNDSMLIISEETDDNNDHTSDNTTLNCSPLETIININMNCTNVSTTDIRVSLERWTNSACLKITD